MVALLAFLWAAQIGITTDKNEFSMLCEVELVLRIKSRNGVFSSVEERPRLSYLLTDVGVSPYSYNGESIFKEENSLGLACEKFPNGSTLCSGDSTFGQTVMTTKFELRPDKTFFLHQIGYSSSDTGYKHQAVDKVTVGRCSDFTQ